MGGKSSREDSGRSSSRSTFFPSYSSGGGGGYPRDQPSWSAPAYEPAERSAQPQAQAQAQHEGYGVPYSVPTTSYPAHQPHPGRRLDRKYSRIADDYNSLEEV